MLPRNLDDSGVAYFNPSYDWSFRSTPQPGSNGQEIAANRGKMLGGSSGLNAMTWNRASALEYDSWSLFAEGGDWTWSSMLTYMKKASTIIQDQLNVFANITGATGLEGDLADFEGFSGPINVRSCLSHLRLPFIPNDMLMSFHELLALIVCWLVCPSQASYNVYYSDIVTPYVQTLVGLGVELNLDPVSRSTLFQRHHELTYVHRTMGIRPAS